MDPEIFIRNYEASDIDQITSLIAELGYPNSREFFASRFEILERSKCDRELVATRGNEIVGLMTLHFIPLPHQAGNLCRIVALIVGFEARRRGVGANLMTAAEEIALSHGCIKMEVTSGDQRTDVHAFYEALGYEEVSRRFVKKLEYGGDNALS